MDRTFRDILCAHEREDNATIKSEKAAMNAIRAEFSNAEKLITQAHEKDIRRISPYCGNTPLTDPYLSPAYADLHGFPKTLILCGGAETSLSDSLMLYDGLSKRGCFAKLHVFQGMWHDFMYMLPRLKESKLAWQEIFDFITADLHPKAEAKCTEQNGTVTRVSRKRRR